MPKLHPENQINIDQGTLKRILGLYGIADFAFSVIGEGIENTSVIVESAGVKRVLRVYSQQKKSDDEILQEIRFQDFLRAQGLPIPKIFPDTHRHELSIAEVKGKRWQCVLMEYVEGKSVTVHPSAKLISKLAQLQARMHVLGIDFAQLEGSQKDIWSQISTPLPERISNPHAWGQEVAGFIMRAKTYRQTIDPLLPHGYMHTDLDFDGNVLTDHDHVTAILDFDDLRYCPAVLCLGNSLWNIWDDEGDEAMHLYLAEYEKARPLASTERKALKDIIMLRNYEVGMVRLLLWEEDTPLSDIQDVLRHEKEIPLLQF